MSTNKWTPIVQTETFTVNWIGFCTILRREIVRFMRIWTQTLLPSVVSMVLYFIIFGNLIGPRIGEMGGVAYIEFLVPGLVMMAIITNAYTNVVFSFFSSKFQKNIEELLVAPLTSSIILWGYVLGGIIRGLLVGLLVILIALFFTQLKIQNLGITILIAFLTAFLFSVAGLLNGIFAKKFDDVNIVPTFILTPLTYLGGVFYSTSMLSELFQKLTYINPIFYMVNAFRYGMLGYSDVDIQTSFIIILLFILMGYGLTLWLLKKGTGIKS